MINVINVRPLISRSSWLLVSIFIIVVATLLVLNNGNRVQAFQPDGLRISQSGMPEVPCPYGHDDVCESAASPPPLHAYFSSNPHDVAGIHAGLDSHTLPLNLGHWHGEIKHRGHQTGSGSTAGDDEPNQSGGGVNLAITTDILGLPWVGDGLTEAEKLTVGWLGTLETLNPSLVSSLTQMPFLRDHTPGDLQAIQTLAFISSRDPGAATDIATDRGFADDGGIDNTEAKIIAVMSIPYIDGDTVLMSLLADYGTVLEQSVTGQHGNPLTFAVVKWKRTVNSPGTVMETAIAATRHAETVMGKPLPIDFVGILVEDMDGAAGANSGISIQLDECYGRTWIQVCSDRARQRVVAHEIGHYWWGAGLGNTHHEDWISEGAAEYIGAYSERVQFGLSDVQTDNWPCPYYRTIEHLRADRPQYRSNGSFCNYALGERLFINLDRSMEDTEFNTAFGNLHHRLTTYEDDGIDQGLSLLRAFCPDCESNPRNLGSVGNTLARRYGEKVLTDARQPTGLMPELGQATGTRIVDWSTGNQQYGVAQIPASSADQRRWLTVLFSEVANPPDTAKIYVAMYHEDREPYVVWPQERTVYSNENAAWFNAFLGEPYRRVPGHHWVYVYNESFEKVAEAEYQVMP